MADKPPSSNRYEECFSWWVEQAYHCSYVGLILLFDNIGSDGPEAAIKEYVTSQWDHSSQLLILLLVGFRLGQVFEGKLVIVVFSCIDWSRLFVFRVSCFLFRVSCFVSIRLGCTMVARTTGEGRCWTELILNRANENKQITHDI